MLDFAHPWPLILLSEMLRIVTSRFVPNNKHSVIPNYLLSEYMIFQTESRGIHPSTTSAQQSASQKSVWDDTRSIQRKSFAIPISPMKMPITIHCFWFWIMHVITVVPSQDYLSHLPLSKSKCLRMDIKVCCIAFRLDNAGWPGHH